MNYLKIYNQLIEKRLKNQPTEYFEKHHIKPKSLFPQLAKDKNNLVKLTYREHYIAHWLLTKIYPSKEMFYAFWRMNCCQNDLYINSYAYEKIRNNIIQIIKKQDVKGKKNPFYGKHHSEETKRRISEANKGKKRPAGEKNPMFGRKHSEQSKRKMSESHKGKIPWNKGKKKGIDY